MMFLEWDLTVRFYVRETFLGKGNLAAFNNVTRNIASGLPRLADGNKVRRWIIVAPAACSPIIPYLHSRFQASTLRRQMSSHH
jgi:hypothetical protein